jgi:hypothetical protein
MSHENFHQHGAAEVRLTVLQRTGDPDEIRKANPPKQDEKAEAYENRLEELHAATAKRVDFHIFEAEEFLPGALQTLFDSAPAVGAKYDLQFTADRKLIKTVNQLKSENPQGKDEKAEAYNERIQKLFEAQKS